MWGQNFLPSSTISLVFSSFSFSFLLFSFLGFSYSQVHFFSFELSSCNFFILFLFLFKQWLLLQALVLLQATMKSFMTWIKKLQCTFILNLAFKVKPFQLVEPKWPSFVKYFLCSGCLWCIYLYCSSFGKDDKQYGTNFWEGETFSCRDNT
jgi:hypothetical protein